MTTPITLQAARAVADAVLYEGYLLYPYRADTAKNQIRWQFGVLSPPGAAAAGLGEADSLHTQLPVRLSGPRPRVTVRLRFLQIQDRDVESAPGRRVPRLQSAGSTWLSWSEAVEQEMLLGPVALGGRLARVVRPVRIPGGDDVEPLDPPARVVRSRWPLQAEVRLNWEPGDPASGIGRLGVEVLNTAGPAADRDDATHRSLTGTHLLLTCEDARFVSVIDPPDDARESARGCVQSRCWPVLCGTDGEQEADVALAAPIILYDHPETAAQSAGDLFDATEIDEILTLRVMTMTDAEKAEARATDPRAAAIIDRCDAMAPQELQQLHGVLRDPRAGTEQLTGDDWWAAEAAAEVAPETDEVNVGGVVIRGGSRVRLRPSRRADAQDIFLAGQEATVRAVHTDLDGATHVSVTLLDDPAAEMHEWYGRYLYFAPDELEPVMAEPEQRLEET